MPHDLDAELGVLGGVLLEPVRLGTLPLLETDDFYDPRHKAVFGAMRRLEADLRPIDPVTVGDALGAKRDACESVLGDALLRVPTWERVEEYAAIVRRHSITRRAMVELADVVEAARRGDIEGDAVVVEAMSRMARIEVGGSDRGRAMGQLIREEFEAIARDTAAMAEGRPVHVGVPTGLAQLDKFIGGIPVKLLTVLAGQPGNGKSTLAQTFLRNAADMTPDTPVLYSYEDSGQSFAQREMAHWTGVPTQSIRARDFQYGHQAAIGAKGKSLGKRREIVVQAHGMDIDELCRDVRRRRGKAKAEGRSECGLVIIDYLQNIPTYSRKSAERVMEYGDMCRKLVSLADTEHIAVILCSQINRGSENRDDKRPTMHDMRGSGEIEEKCKCMLGVYRPSKYEQGADPSLLEVLILKNHQGEAPVVAEMHWNLATHSILDRRS